MKKQKNSGFVEFCGGLKYIVEPPVKNNITEIVFILDNSGSMHGYEKDVTGSFNALINSQKQLDGTVYVTTVLFNSKQKCLHDRVNISDISPMGPRDYTTQGNTALLDAVGDTIKHISTIHRYIRPEDLPQNTIIVINTDGMENASSKYDFEEIKYMVEEKQEKEGWEFIFLGAEIDSFDLGSQIGVKTGHIFDCVKGCFGTEDDEDLLDEEIKAIRAKY